MEDFVGVGEFSYINDVCTLKGNRIPVFVFFFATVLRDYQTAMSWTAIFILGLFVFSSAFANERE